MQDVIIIGCGVIGAACAYELSKYDLKVTVLERSNDVANGTSKANSAIVHGGYDPHPGEMARLNVKGNALMEPLCKKLDVPFRRTGSHVLAFSEEDLETLKILYDRGTANGVPGLRLLTGAEARAMEPKLADTVTGSLWAPSAGIVSPWELTLAMAETAVKNGVKLELEAEVTAIEKVEDHFVVTTPRGVFEASYLINAAGCHADRVQALAGTAEFTLTPNRGEYYLLDKSQGTLVNSVIFQCPTPQGKGVLVAPTVHGNLIVGPTSGRVDDPDDTANTADALAYCRKMALKSVPSVNFRENIRNFSGVRANHSKDAFLIGESQTVPGMYLLAGIKSPGLTAAPAIGAETAAYFAEKLHAAKKEAYCDSRKRIRFQELSGEEKNALIRENPLYGRVICRCETVTEGEIVAAIHAPIPAVTVNAVKRRVGAGMGRCQGGFCGPRVQEILARELGLPQSAILLDQPGSYVLTGETKGGTANENL